MLQYRELSLFEEMLLHVSPCVSFMRLRMCLRMSSTLYPKASLYVSPILIPMVSPKVSPYVSPYVSPEASPKLCP